MITHTVGSMEDGKKVHRLVRQLLPGVPLSGIHKMIRVGRVRLNGKKAKPDILVSAGDVLELRMSEEDFTAVSKPVRKYQGVPREIDVVYEDEEFIAVNKPVGLLTHGNAEEQKDTLVNRVLAYLHDRDRQTSSFAPAPANRLDRNTSGIILFGKTGGAARELAEGFKIHSIRKWYLTVVRGTVDDAGTISAPLSRDADRNVTTVDESGKAAFTTYEPLASTGDTTVLRLELISGRTHQIRAHMQHIGHSLLSDRKYHGRKAMSPPRAHGDEQGHRSRPTSQRDGRMTGRMQEREVERYLLHAGWILLPNRMLLHAPIPVAFRGRLAELGYSASLIEKLDTTKPDL